MTSGPTAHGSAEHSAAEQGPAEQGHDPYREWLRTRLGRELGLPGAEAAIQGAVQRRGWPALRALGPRDVVAVLQDVYSGLRQSAGDTRADAWLQRTTVDLAEYAQTVPVPAQPTPGPLAPAPTPAPPRWGRRAHDLPLLLARANAEIAGRTLAAVRADATLAGLAGTAEWDVQAALAEVRRWETEEMLGSLRADQSRVEVADAVAAAAAQAGWLRLHVRELQAEERRGLGVGPQLAHARLTLTQLDAFLKAFVPLIDPGDADLPLSSPQARLDGAFFSLEVPLNPAVLRARHALKLAQWRAGADPAAAVTHAQHALDAAETEARAQLETTLQSARTAQARFAPLWDRVGALEERLRVLGQRGGDPLSLARARLDWRQARAAARVQAHLLEQATRWLEALADVAGPPGHAPGQTGETAKKPQAAPRAPRQPTAYPASMTTQAGTQAGEVSFKDNAAEQQYEVYVDGQLAGHAAYRPLDGSRELPHTEIDGRYEGQGLGSRLVGFALDDLRSRDLNVVPTCPFVAAYIREHPGYQELVPPEQRQALGL